MITQSQIQQVSDEIARRFQAEWMTAQEKKPGSVSRAFC
jgi:hypothetical protein